jgi:hypothetical protein
VYYVNEVEGASVLVRYDISTKTKSSVRASAGYTIIDVAISENLLVLLQNGREMILGLLVP